VIAARGFENEPYFEMAAATSAPCPSSRAPPTSTCAGPEVPRQLPVPAAAYPAIPRRDDPADDVFFFRQGPAKGLGKVRFHDWRLAFDGVDLPNVRIFVEQVEP